MEGLGITGTRKGMTSRQILRIQSWENTLAEWYDTLHHGDCVGSDEEMVVIVRHYMTIVSHPPIRQEFRAYAYYDKERKLKEYLERNRDIVDESGLLIATPGGPEQKRSGTWYTIRYAISQNKKAIIVWPDGSHERR